MSGNEKEAPTRGGILSRAWAVQNHVGARIESYEMLPAGQRKGAVFDLCLEGYSAGMNMGFENGKAFALDMSKRRDEPEVSQAASAQLRAIREAAASAGWDGICLLTDWIKGGAA